MIDTTKETRIQIPFGTIIIDMVGHDWSENGDSVGKYYAQRIDNIHGGPYAFGDTQGEALANLLTNKSN